MDLNHQIELRVRNFCNFIRTLIINVDLLRT
jgi:hypothetical protein